jgi:UDP-2,4-diacetamido-2,4,6-trideoxy-beta-L-altropyranose hydrolase
MSGIAGEVKTLIATEGFKGTGYGHLMRCLSLYQAFEETGTTITYVADCDDVGARFLGDINLVVMDWRKNSHELVSLSANCDVVVIDSYLADSQIYDRLSKACGNVAYIDDNRRIPYPPGVIVNGTIGADRLPHSRDHAHRYLLGIDYIPLRREFWDVSPWIGRQKIENVLLVFGAQDVRDMARSTLSYLLRVFPEYNYHVLHSPTSNGSEGVFTSDRARVYRNLTASEILQLMMSCDLAISAAGLTTYELARIGLPTIAIGVAENQQATIRGWIEAGFLRSGLWWEDAGLLDAIAGELREITAESRQPGPFGDGQGARRIAKYLCEYHGSYSAKST